MPSSITYPQPLVSFFQDQQTIALLILVILVGMTAWAPTARVRTLAGVLTILYGFVAFLVILSLIGHRVGG